MIYFAFVSVVDNSSQSDNVAEQRSPPLQQALMKINRTVGPIEVCYYID